MILRRSLFLAAAAAALGLSASAGPMSQTLQGRQLSLDNLRANVEIRVDPSAQGFRVDVDGQDELTRLITMGTRSDQTAYVEMSDNPDHNWRDDIDNMGVRITINVPAGTDLGIDGFVGTINTGDLGSLAVGASGAGRMSFGSVDDAAIEASGSSDVTMGDVRGQFAISASGSGKVRAGKAGATTIEVSGSGDADIAAVNGPLNIDINGSADIVIGSINGPTQIDISGSGSITMKSGTANPLQVDSSGSGEIHFNGTAVNPQISASGSGDVCIARVEGSIELDGANVTIDPERCRL